MFAVLVALAAGIALLAAADFGSASDTAGLLAILPFLTAHLLHKAGVPGVLEHNGLCGWGWCSPTLLGGALTLALWAGLFWFVAKAIAAVVNAVRTRRAARSLPAATGD